MLITILQNLLKILIFSLIFALEISVAIPVVSLVFVSLAVRKERESAQIFLLLVASLVASSFLSVSWSVVVLVFGLGWLGLQALGKTKFHIQNAAFLVSLTMSMVLASVAQLTFNYKTVLFTLLFCGIALITTRLFLPRKVRHTVIEWFSPGRV